ncbi:BRAT1 protein, partial [Bucco capensis]|nr:BRAT1 protein [Bucco capensis]
MTHECSLLLPRVCAALAHPRQPNTDDTCLEKLLDWFELLTKCDNSVELLEDNPCLTEFINSMLALPQPSPSILSFTLRLAGILAVSKSRFKRLQQEQLLARLFGRDGPPSSELWRYASVRSGWVNGVCNMMCHQDALHLICSTGGIDVIFTLQGDPSLFVASAASQLLVDMLTLSVGNEMTQPLGTKDWEWPACAQVIIKHVEDSLRSGSASRIEHSLKLLTNLFGCCYDAWTEVIWLDVAEQVESFLTEETVQAQHMLVNLLVKMAWSPVFSDTKSHFWTLVTSALKHLTPVQAGPLAVRLLKFFKCPEDVRIQALTVLLQPMDCVLRAASQPMEYAGLLDKSVSDPITVEGLLASKSSCANLLCQTLAHLDELLCRSSFQVDLPHTALLRSLITILQFCNGILSPASPLGSMISQNLINCFRVQKSALDVLAVLSDGTGCDTLRESLFDVLLAYLESPNTSPTVLKKTFQATSRWLVHVQKLSCSDSESQQTQKVLKDVLLVLQKRLCNPYWEVRDSSLEFLTDLIKSFRDQDEFRQSLLSSEVPRLTENLLQDSESYVRASAVTALGHLAFITCFAQESPVMGNQYNKESIIAKLQEILSRDPEDFPRRAVINIFTEWVRHGCTGQLEDTEQFVSGVIQIAECDSDWEVRLGGLQLVQDFCKQAHQQLGCPECPVEPDSGALPRSISEHEFLQLLCRAKLFSFLFRSLCDCDKTVGQGACRTLKNLSTKFYPYGTPVCLFETVDLPAGQSIGHLQRMLGQGSLAQDSPSDGFNGVDFEDPETVLLALGNIDLLELRYEFSESSDQVEKRPESLLQDILATAGTVTQNEADCY